METSMLDSAWVLICVVFVFLMQGGFLCLETGLTRGKDAINVGLKTMTNFSLSIVMYWAFGFAIMFGASRAGLFGTSHFFVSPSEYGSSTTIIFLFQAMFCATASTIVSGAVAGRMRFAAYIATTCIVSGVIYPVLGHWAWGGSLGGPSGWLADSGFVDFSGSAVVHSVGGWAALGAVLVIGARAGRFDEGRPPKAIPGSNPPMMMFGAMLLWIGWIGFNGGSTLAMNDAVGGIILNTLLALAAGMLTGLAISWVRHGYADVTTSVNGSLAGLVAITASCHAVSPAAAIIIGAVGAAVMTIAQSALNHFRIDDAIGAIPVHAAAGTWGAIAVALFGDLESLGTGLSRWQQLHVQATGVFVIGAATVSVTYVLLRIVELFMDLRVTNEEELIGLNISEHGAATELNQLLSEMETQRKTGDFSARVTIDSFSEVGQIAEQYNRVLAVINIERRQLLDSGRRTHAANDELVLARQSIENKLEELTQFNDIAVDRELRMLELKQEINNLCRDNDLSPRYQMEPDEERMEALS